MEKIPTLQGISRLYKRSLIPVGWISRKHLDSGRGRTFLLTSLFIELIDVRRGFERQRLDYNKSHQALACGLKSGGHLRDACTLMLRDHKLVRSRLGAVLSGSRRRTVWRPMSLSNLFVSVAIRHDDES